jgi:hypothetical protein
MYYCNCCKYAIGKKYNYIRHLRTFKHLQTKLEKEQRKANYLSSTFQNNNLDEDDNYLCKYCSKKFNTHASMRRHETHWCKNNIDLINNIEINKLKQEHEDNTQILHQHIKSLIAKAGYTTNNTTINNTINANTTNNIKINKYGQENMDYITDKLKTYLLRMPGSMIRELITKIHFNKNHPENYNIRITDIKSKFAETYDGLDWNLVIKNDALFNLVDDKYLILYNHFDEIEEKMLTSNEKHRYISYQDRYEAQKAQFLKRLIADAEVTVINNTRKMNKYIDHA